jgi:hypothetical protein
MKRILFVATFLVLGYQITNAQIYRVAQMNAEQIRALDKQKTVVVLTGGILEEHGAHLPSYTDAYVNEWRSERLAEAIAERPGWSALMFPTIPLGSGARTRSATNSFSPRPTPSAGRPSAPSTWIWRPTDSHGGLSSS